MKRLFENWKSFVKEGEEMWMDTFGITNDQYKELKLARATQHGSIAKGDPGLVATRFTRNGIEAEWEDGLTTTLKPSRRQPDYERD